MEERPTPDYAQVVLIPVANPATARGLIQLGLALAHPEEGRVIPLTVSLGEAEREAESIEQIEPICDALSTEGREVELKTVTAPSIARGILDAIREENADLVVLGLNKPDHGQVVVGAIPESVAETAHCDVLIYRAGVSSIDFGRVVVPANGSDHARVASRVAIMLGESFHKPIEAIYVHNSSSAYWQGRGRLEETLRDVPGQAIVKRTLVTGQNPTSGILSRIDEDDLVVVGYSRRSDLQRWLYGDFSRELLNRAPGPVVLASRLVDPITDDNLLERFWRWSRPTLTQVEQGEMVRTAQGMAAASLDYTVLIVISAILASFGLLTDSGAVIIGAMLVAPLMSPLIALSVGIVTGRLPLVQRAMVSVVQGFALAFGIAFVVGEFSLTNIVTAEMLARGNPTVLDMGVALASGFIGAYATARKDIPAALAGVAIAAALMPPVCTIALGFAYDNIPLARGAGLLFLTNIISIILVASIVFFWLGMRPKVVENSRIRQYTSVALLAVFVIVISVFFLRDVNPRRFEAGIEDTLRDAFQTDELVDFEIRRGDPLQVIATVRRPGSRLTDNQEVIVAQQALKATFDQPIELEVIVEPVFNAENALANQVLSDALRPIRVLNTEVAHNGDEIEVTAIVSAANLNRARQQTEQAQAALAASFGGPVSLNIVAEESN